MLVTTEVEWDGLIETVMRKLGIECAADEQAGDEPEEWPEFGQSAHEDAPRNNYSDLEKLLRDKVGI